MDTRDTHFFLLEVSGNVYVVKVDNIRYEVHSIIFFLDKISGKNQHGERVIGRTPTSLTSKRERKEK